MKNLFAIIFILCAVSLSAQSTDQSVVKNLIGIGGEFVYDPAGLGQFGVGVNYERKFLHSHLGAGIGATLYLRGSKGIPLKLNYLFFKNKNHLEIGLSYIYLFNQKIVGNVTSINLGYRLEDFSKSGVSIAFGIAPSIVNQQYNGVTSNYSFLRAYFGIGYLF